MKINQVHKCKNCFKCLKMIKFDNDLFSQINYCILIILFFSCTKDEEKRNLFLKKTNPELYNVTDTSIQSSPKDTIVPITVEELRKTLYRQSNLIKSKFDNPFESATFQKMHDSLFVLKTSCKVAQHKISYEVFIKKPLETPPYFLYFQKDNYLKSIFSIDGYSFNLNELSIKPYEVFGKEYIDSPLTLHEFSNYTTFNFKDVEYIVLYSSKACSGNSCRNSYLLLIEITNSKINIYLIHFNDYFPFEFDNLFIGDINGDQLLDFYYVFEVEHLLKYTVKLYSLANGELVPVKNDQGQDLYVYFSCEKCVALAATDTLSIIETNLFDKKKKMQ